MSKKRMVILLIILIVLSFVVTFIISEKPKIERNIKKEQEQVEKHEKETSDKTPPRLQLSISSLIIYQNDEINYRAFIKKATDNLEGDIADKVRYNEIDTSETGIHLIVYKCSDMASNEATATVEVTVKERVSFDGNATNGRTEDE